MELLETSQVLKNLFETKDIPIEVSFRLATFGKQLKEPVETYIEMKKKLAERYADRDEHGQLHVQEGKYIIIREKEAFAREWQNLADIETEIEKPIIQLGLWAQGKISAKDMRELSVLIKFTFREDNIQ